MPHDRWHTVRHLATVTSTQDVARDELAAGAQPGLVVVADAQTSGRGRKGRAWTDHLTRPDGSPTNLAVTATSPPPRNGGGLVPLAAGVAVAALADSLGASAGLKWPNDVVAGDRKVAGILVERRTIAPAGDVLLIGVGVDVDWRDVDRPDDGAVWTSLAEQLGRSIDRDAVLATLLRELGDILDLLDTDPDAVLDSYRGHCVTIGREVRVETAPGDEVRGRAVDVDDAGRLLVDAGGTTRAIAAGDVVHLR